MMDQVTVEEPLRSTECERLRALVAGDLAVAELLHADDFQLITPGGTVMSREQYLGGIASGYLNYHLWEPDSPILVRLHERVAFLRYRARLHIARAGGAVSRLRCWHTDTYEHRDGRWQVVWSQATSTRSRKSLPG